MTAYFISDLHLTAQRAAANQQFFEFLRASPQSGDALYILGDLFEYWAGDDDLDDALNAAVGVALTACAGRGVAQYFIHGNRDFLIGQKFADSARLTLLVDGATFDLHGPRTVFLHGDTLCTGDRAYQQFRAKVRAKDWRDSFLARSLADRKAEIENMRAMSETEKSNKPADIMDVSETAVKNLFQESGAARMIHGHTHRPARHDYLMFGRNCVRWVLPAWDQRPGYLRIDPAGDELIYL